MIITNLSHADSIESHDIPHSHDMMEKHSRLTLFPKYPPWHAQRKTILQNPA